VTKTSEGSGWPLGARVQRVDGPQRGVVVLGLHPPTGYLLLSANADAPGWGWLHDRPRGRAAEGPIARLRRSLVGLRLTSISAEEDGGRLELTKGDRHVRLLLGENPPNLWVEGLEAPFALFAQGTEPRGRPGRWPATFEAAREAGPSLWEALSQGPLELERRRWARALKSREKALRRRRTAIEGDLDRVDDVAALREEGGLLLANLTRLPERAGEVTVEAFDGSGPVTVAIHPERTIKEDAEARFRRARKLERGAEIALERLEATEAELSEVEALRRALREASGEAAIEAVQVAAKRLRIRPQARSAEEAERQRIPYRTFHDARGRPILVGRSAADNDALTLRHARPWDAWLHARGVPGSHVVVPLERDRPMTPGQLTDAGHLALHFSRARGEKKAEIQYVQRRYVRKPRGAPPGAVIVERERVLLLETEPETLARLLASESLE
jgi:hypothetical protein